MDMRCTTDIMSWEDGFELDYAILVGLLHTTEERSVEIGLVSEVAVPRSNNTRIDTLLILELCPSSVLPWAG